MARATQSMDTRGRAAGQRRNMPRGRIPQNVKTQSQMYANDGVSAFGNIVKGKGTNRNPQTTKS